MTIERTIDIPANRRLTLEVPSEIPAGKATLTFTSVKEEPLTGAARFESALAELKKSKSIMDKIKSILADSDEYSTPHADFLSGVLAGAGDIALEQIREERLAAKYLK